MGEKGGIYSWTFKILVKKTSMYLGICSVKGGDAEIDNDIWKMKDGHNYCLSTTGTKVKNTERMSSGCSGFSAGDVIEMKLDLNDRTLRYFVSDKYKGRSIGFDNIP